MKKKQYITDIKKQGKLYLKFKNKLKIYLLFYFLEIIKLKKNIFINVTDKM